MKIQIIEQARYTIAAYVEDDGSLEQPTIPVMDDLRRLGAKYKGSVKGVVTLFKIYAKNGKGRPYGVTNDQMHHAHYDPDIYEFIKGDLRAFCFLDGNRLILTNAGLKKGQKANPKDVQRAIHVRHAYFDAKDSKSIEMLDKE